MSLFKRTRSIAVIAVMLASAGVLGACSFQPVYSGALAASPMLNLAYAKPGNRLQQIVYQELALRFGSSDAPTAPLASVSLSTSVGGIAALTAANGVATPYRVTVTATLIITQRADPTTKPLSLTRTASAEYTSTGQVLADTTAATEASERAAKAVAESLRLGILATLSR